jgi:hypothetical protein
MVVSLPSEVNTQIHPRRRTSNLHNLLRNIKSSFTPEETKGKDPLWLSVNADY